MCALYMKLNIMFKYSGENYAKRFSDWLLILEAYSKRYNGKWDIKILYFEIDQHTVMFYVFKINFAIVYKETYGHKPVFVLSPNFHVEEKHQLYQFLMYAWSLTQKGIEPTGLLAFNATTLTLGGFK